MLSLVNIFLLLFLVCFLPSFSGAQRLLEITVKQYYWYLYGAFLLLRFEPNVHTLALL